MTPKEILADFVKDINNHFSRVHQSKTMYCDIAVGELPDNIADYTPIKGVGLCRIFEHTTIPTKPYQDEGCAAYKLMRYIENFVRGKTEELFWRCEPEINKQQDFDELQTWFKGYARLSVF